MTTKTKRALMPHVQAFFEEYLAAHRGLSANTVMAYRDALKLFFRFVSDSHKRSVATLALEDLTAKTVLAFLADIEGRRGNGIVTRNLRLAAVKSFVNYLTSQDPLRAGEYHRIAAIPVKRAPRRVMGYLEVAEMQAILKAIDRTHPRGERDYVLLSLLYNTGARVQEICDLRIDSLRLEGPPVVTIVGKGRKTRCVPLWKETAQLLRDYLADDPPPERPLFLNARGAPLGRFGVRHILQTRVREASGRCPTIKGRRIGPHTLRHTTAMHLLQAGVDLSVIKSWLGHVSLSTTHGYVEIDLAMKRKALAACRAPGKPKELKQVLNRHRDVIQWLESF
ncbi:site-specific integrase [Acidiferrobacter sp.]|uniref:site-specific integrase n=1 Tax=Acidiferrobacter sp. TaxID=1872107 RepID=UPI00261268D3|nr:site-specific integrase [Acidiferrobacter sp.]